MLSELEAKIKLKIEAVGVPLKQWDIQINYGIKTGFNEAFIIDEAKRTELLKNCPEADEIIRPILLGKNIKRYKYNWENLWLINSHNGVKGRINRIDVENDYPTVYEYFKEYLPEISKRFDQGDKWTNLRNCAYLMQFDEPKIAWGNLGLRGQFAYVKEPMLINAPSPFFVTDKRYLLAILNSKLSDFYIKQLGVTRNGGYFEYKPMFIEKLPIPFISADHQEKLLNLINALKTNDDLDIDMQIDQCVYEIYDLSEEQVNFIDKIKSQ